jgi:hypothetical protein
MPTNEWHLQMDEHSATGVLYAAIEKVRRK